MRRWKRAAVAALTLAALVVPLSSAPAGVADLLSTGCHAVNLTGGTGCSYYSEGGVVQFVAVTTGHWAVFWGPFGNEFQNKCGEGNAPGVIGKCSVPAGFNTVVAQVFKGVIVVRDRPGPL
jgi:hypothetical protein